jgi:mono/diheme cytochrome c family protein
LPQGVSAETMEARVIKETIVHMRIALISLTVLWVAATWMDVNVRAQALKGGNPKAAAVTNPVPPTPASITKGRQEFSRACRKCHGLRGKGDGPEAPVLDPPPANLTDATWLYGSTDGEIFSVIANGVGGKSGMKGLRSQVSATGMWNIVNYIRSIGPPSMAQR